MSFTAQSSLPKQYSTYDFIAPSRFTGRLKGKVTLVTGASAGIGRKSCLAFAAAGASVACVARRQADLDALVDEIKSQHGVSATAVAADVSDPTSAKKIVENVERELGPVDILLNCAGITRMGALVDEENFSTWWRVLEVNLRGPVALTHAVLPSMVERKTGTIITVSSTAGSQDIALVTAYATSKAAVIKFQQDLAAEVGRHGITTYSIHPGTVATDLGAIEGAINMESMQQEPEAQRQFQEFKDLKYQTPELMADSCVALCAEERFRVLSGRFVDCEQRLDRVLEEAEKEEKGRVGKENLYRLKLEEL